jgi:16S rRNA (adenine1518-N6/adenine1519-N6)-dimethyltransferase
LALKFQTKKSLGQNFLIDADALAQISAALDLKSSDHVLEIGPGLGFLTRYLIDSGATVTAVELDSHCVRYLNDLKAPNLTVVHEDILNFDYPAYLGKQFKVIGNIPYSITSPIFARLFGEIGAPAPWLSRVERAVFTVQKEMADRFIAQPDCREYSLLTLLTNYFCRVEKILSVPRTSFQPKPKVNSTVLRFFPLERPPIDVKNIKLLKQITRAGFKQRRKMIKNNLSFLNLFDDELTELFCELKLDPRARAESLSLKQYALLTNRLDNQ